MDRDTNRNRIGDRRKVLEIESERERRKTKKEYQGKREMEDKKRKRSVVHCNKQSIVRVVFVKDRIWFWHRNSIKSMTDSFETDRIDKKNENKKMNRKSKGSRNNEQTKDGKRTKKRQISNKKTNVDKWTREKKRWITTTIRSFI